MGARRKNCSLRRAFHCSNRATCMEHSLAWRLVMDRQNQLVTSWEDRLRDLYDGGGTNASQSCYPWF